jgi:hypothetical protein
MCRVWNEAKNEYSAIGTQARQCVGTAGTTIVTRKGSQGNLGYASLQALVQAQGIRGEAVKGRGVLLL